MLVLALVLRAWAACIALPFAPPVRCGQDRGSMAPALESQLSMAVWFETLLCNALVLCSRPARALFLRHRDKTTHMSPYLANETCDSRQTNCSTFARPSRVYPCKNTATFARDGPVIANLPHHATHHHLACSSVLSRIPAFDQARCIGGCVWFWGTNIRDETL